MQSLTLIEEHNIRIRIRMHFLNVSYLMTKPTKWPLCPAKTQISLGIRPVWSESSQCTQWVAEDPVFLHADSKDSDQTGRMHRLICVFAWRNGHFAGFVMRRLTFRKCILIFASGLRNKPHFWRPCSLSLWLQSQGSLPQPCHILVTRVIYVASAIK